MEYNLEKKKKTFIFISVFLVILNSMLAGIGIYGYRTSPPLFVAAIIFTALTIKLYRKEKIVGNLPKCITVLFIIMGISYGLWGVVYFVPTYVLCGYAFLIQLPLFYMCANRDDIKYLVICYSKAYVILSAIVFFICLMIAPLTGGQYCGVFNNPNLLGHVLSSVAMCIFFLFETEIHLRYRIALLSLFGLLVAFTLFSRSRTTLLAIICVTAVYCVYLVITKKGLLKRVAAFLFAIIIIVPLTSMFFQKVTPKICQLTGIEVDMSRYNLQWELAAAYEKYLKGLNKDGSFTSGRVQIWRDFISKIELKGHEIDVLVVDYSGGSFSVNAHNTFIQVAYQSGALAGIAFICIIVILGIFVLRNMCINKITVYDLFAVGCIANVLPYLLLANVVFPYTSYSMLPVWIIVMPYYFVKYRKGDKVCNLET